MAYDEVPVSARSPFTPGVVRRLLGLLVAPAPVVVVLVFTTAVQNARGTSLLASALSLAPTLAPVLYGVTLLIATLVAVPVLYLVTRLRGRHRAADYVAVGAGTGFVTMLGYHAALTGLSLDTDGGEGLRLLAIGTGLGALSAGLGFLVTASGRMERRGTGSPRGNDRSPVA